MLKKAIALPLLLGLGLYGLYIAKSRGYVQFDWIKGHSPQKLEELSGGLIQCRWFPNPGHCGRGKH